MPVKSAKEAYRTLSKHIFLASRAYSNEYEPIIILENSLSDAMCVAKERFGTSNDRAIRIEQLKATDNMQVFEIKSGSDRDKLRKKVWGRIGMSAELTDREFNVLQSGEGMAKDLVRSLMKTGRLQLDGETYFPETSENGMHEIDKEICLEL